MAMTRVHQIGRLLGRGSNGAVYAATLDDGAEVAVKVRSLARSGSWKTHERFERSARWLTALTHRAFPRVYGFEPMGSEGRAFLLLERIDGGTLGARIARSRLDETALRTILRRLLEALAVLHGHTPPLVHRDVSPCNVAFRDETFNDPVLLDCDGLAALHEQDDAELIVGTPGFLAPEQIAGRARPASDVYGVAATVLFAATGVDVDGHPRRNGQIAIASRPSLPPDLRALLTAMLEGDPTDRPSAVEALNALDGVPLRRAARAAIRSRVGTAASVALAITLLGALPFQHVEAARGVAADAAEGECRISSDPPGATIYLGDRDVPWSDDHPLDQALGVTPRVVPRDPARPLILHKNGFRPLVVELTAPRHGERSCAFTAKLTAD